MDFKLIIAELEKQGLHLTEEAIKAITKAVFKAGEDALAKSSNPVAVAAAGLMPIVENMLLKLEDKIDGIEGN